LLEVYEFQVPLRCALLYKCVASIDSAERRSIRSRSAKQIDVDMGLMERIQ
jgi:hypothetical protein